MEIIVNNLRVLEHGSLVMRKDSTVDFRLDADHTFTLEFSSQENNNSPSLVRGNSDDNHMVLKCVNFGRMGISHGLVKPLSVLKLKDGSHVFLQFSVSGSGVSSRILNYTWYTEDNPNEKEEDNSSLSDMPDIGE